MRRRTQVTDVHFCRGPLQKLAHSHRTCKGVLAVDAPQHTFVTCPIQVQRPSFFKSSSLYFEQAFLAMSFETCLPFNLGGPVIALPVLAPSASCLATALSLFCC